MKIVGKEHIEYVSKKTQQPVKGISLHCTSTRNSVEGSAVETVFISARSDLYNEVAKMPLGQDIICSYNRYGSVDSVMACK